MRNAGLDTITQGHARAPSHAPCLLEPLERLKMKCVTAVRQIRLLTKAKLHRLLCFCTVAREHWLPSLIFFLRSLNSISKQVIPHALEEIKPAALGPLSPTVFPKSRISLSHFPSACHGMREQELRLGHNYKLVYWLAGSYKQWLIAKFCLSYSRWGTNFGLSLLSSHRLS